MPFAEQFALPCEVELGTVFPRKNEFGHIFLLRWARLHFEARPANAKAASPRAPNTARKGNHSASATASSASGARSRSTAKHGKPCHSPSAKMPSPSPTAVGASAKGKGCTPVCGIRKPPASRTSQ